jgi:hypothetical protein
VLNPVDIRIRSFQAWVAPFLAIIVITLAACGEQPGKVPGQTAQEEAGFSWGQAIRNIPEQAPACFDNNGSELRITSLESDSSGLHIEVMLPADTKLAGKSAYFFACLREKHDADGKQQDHEVETTFLKLGDEDKFQTAADDALSTDTTHSTETLQMIRRLNGDVKVKFQGYIRFWPIYRIEITRNFIVHSGRANAGDNGIMTAGISIGLDADDLTTKTYSGRSPMADAVMPLEMEDLVRQLVINPEDTTRFQTANPPIPKGMFIDSTDPRSLINVGGAWARIRLEEDGLRFIPGENFQEPGLEGFTGDLDSIRLFSRGRAVPLIRVSETTGTLGPRIYFYAWPTKSDYTRESVYWITSAPDAPDPRIEPYQYVEITSDPPPLGSVRRIERLENDLEMKLKLGDFLSIDKIDWVDREILDDQPVEIPFELICPVTDLRAGKIDGSITLLTTGDSSFSLSTELELKHGEHILSSHTLDRTEETVWKISIPGSVFTDNKTTLTLHVSKSTSSTLSGEDTNGIWFDFMEIDYESRPSLIDGRLVIDNETTSHPGTYLLDQDSLEHDHPSGLLGLAVNRESFEINTLERRGSAFVVHRDDEWHSEIFDLGAVPSLIPEPVLWNDSILRTDDDFDYLVISHPRFIPLLEPFLELNQRRKIRTRVVDIHDVYDLFGDGVFNPEAIRRMLAWGLRNWKDGGPEYVLLFGDCSSDYLNQTRSDVENLVPSYSFEYQKEKWASDYWFSCVSGQDDFADLMIGRFSVFEEKDAETIIQKNIEYVENQQVGPWRARMCYVADNFEQFRQVAEEMRKDHTPASFAARRVYLDDLPLEDNWYLPEKYIEREYDVHGNWMKVSRRATNLIKHYFDEGVSHMEFWGHGAPNIWTDERIWFGMDSSSRDSQYLNPAPIYPFIANYTCNSGAIDYPKRPYNLNISEDLMRQPDAGAVGMFVPSGPGNTAVHKRIVQQWRTALFKDNMRQFGGLSSMTRFRFLGLGGARHMAYMYLLLGDPVSSLNLTTQWRELEFNKVLIKSGEKGVTASLDQVIPAEGKVLAWIEDEQGMILYEGEEQDYANGTIRYPLDIPVSSKPSMTYRVMMYAWNESEDTELTAAGEFQTARPRLRILEAKARHGSQGEIRFTIRLENDSSVEANEFRLDVEYVKGGRRSVVAGTMTQLAAAEEDEIVLNAPAPENPGPAIYRAVLSIVEDHGDMDDPVQPVEVFVLLPEKNWIGFIPRLSWIQKPHSRRTGTLNVVIASNFNPEKYFMLDHPGNTPDSRTTTSLLFSQNDDIYLAEWSRPVSTELLESMADEELKMILMDDSPSTPVEMSGNFKIRSIQRTQPNLRIIPQSISESPSNPTDGETVFIEFEVLNAGNELSHECNPALYDQDPVEGGKKLPVQSQLDITIPNKIPPLGPGRSHIHKLRWDPVMNAGVQDVWISLNTGQVKDDPAYRDQVVKYQFYVRSKSRLTQKVPIKVYQKKEDVDISRFRIVAEVENEGETEARNVEVVFYMTEGEMEKDNRLGLMDIDVIPPGKSRKVELVWDYRKEDFPGDKSPLLKPTTQVHLKGSSQRIIETALEETNL